MNNNGNPETIEASLSEEPQPERRDRGSPLRGGLIRRLQLATPQKKRDTAMSAKEIKSYREGYYKSLERHEERSSIAFSNA